MVIEFRERREKNIKHLNAEERKKNERYSTGKKVYIYIFAMLRTGGKNSFAAEKATKVIHI